MMQMLNKSKSQFMIGINLENDRYHNSLYMIIVMFEIDYTHIGAIKIPILLPGALLKLSILEHCNY